MGILFGILFLVTLGFLIAVLFRNKKLEQKAAVSAEIAEAAQQRCASDILRVQKESQAGLEEAQKELELEHKEMLEETARAKQHYESEARKAQAKANQMVENAIKVYEPLQKYRGMVDVEAESKRLLEEAMREANALKAEAQALIDKTRELSTQERSQAAQKAKEMRGQADAVLNQAVRDAGRIVAEADKRAEQIGGEAYEALRDKQTLEKAVQALWNVTNGYGDRFVVSTRSLLDDLAADFGHTAAGEALRAAREQSRRIVELKEAATSKYEETDRRDRANRFVVDAFNGRVDAILSRAKHDNYGTLEQEIRDAFNLVNLNGLVFRDARILPAYRDARLAELKWAVVVQELRLKEREEQQRIREQIREEDKARRDYERAIREAAKEEDLIRKAMALAQQQVEQATAEQKAKYEQQLSDLAEKLKEAEEKNQRAISMAQQTRRGHVYIISNIGSFGENVYKIGLTRRLEPMDRVRELGDSSVPFGFDVHALIDSEDAPALETQLHKHFVMMQVNKVNYRKEFFRVDLKHIREEIEKLGIAPRWTMTAEATEFRESLAIEKVIQEDPAKREAWIKRQLELEPLDFGLEEDAETIRNGEPVNTAADSEG
jgi:hypothetical protein